MEVVKNIAAVLGVILSSASVLALLSSTVRNGLKHLIFRYGDIEERDDTIQNIKDMLEQHIRDDNEFKEQYRNNNEIILDFVIAQCRGTIKDTFYQYEDTKVLPLYEKKNLMFTGNLYVNRLHCNSWAKFLLDEMDGWSVDYDDRHSGDSDNISIGQH